jgi:phosphoenolpyruvate carboxykinase (GTP)
LKELLRVDVEGWLAEVPGIREYYDQFGDQLPQKLRDELAALEERLRTTRS